MKCKGCGMAGTWARRGRGWAILEPNGQRHRCKRYAKKQKEPAHTVGPRIVGANYSPSCAGCPASPWEHCACYPEGVASAVNAEADAAFQRALEYAEQA